MTAVVAVAWVVAALLYMFAGAVLYYARKWDKATGDPTEVLAMVWPIAIVIIGVSWAAKSIVDAARLRNELRAARQADTQKRIDAATYRSIE